MTEQTRNRVLGGACIVAVLAIVGPALFDGAGVKPVPPTHVSVPEVSVEPTPRGITQGEDWTFVEDVDALRATEGYQRPEADGVRPVLGVPRHEPLPAPEADAAGTDTDVAAQPRPAFTIQLASFASVENARALRDQLLSDGFHAYSAPVRTASGKELVRVAVGPFISQSAAEDVQATLLRRYELEGIMRRYQL